jgi:hypothetical protein
MVGLFSKLKVPVGATLFFSAQILNLHPAQTQSYPSPVVSVGCFHTNTVILRRESSKNIICV